MYGAAVYGSKGRGKEGNVESSFPYLQACDEKRDSTKIRFEDLWRRSPERSPDEDEVQRDKVSMIGKQGFSAGGGAGASSSSHNMPAGAGPAMSPLEEELADDGVAVPGPSREGIAGAREKSGHRMRRGRASLVCLLVNRHARPLSSYPQHI